MKKQLKPKAKTSITSTPAKGKSSTGELSEQELDKVTGGDDESPKETVTFEYGALRVNYKPQGS